MMESLFEELPTIKPDKQDERTQTPERSCLNDGENSLLAVLPTVQAIVRRKMFLSWQTEASDLVQSVALRLWKWQGKFREKSGEMSSEEWQSFAARTAYNEINRHFSQTAVQKNVPLDAASGEASPKTIPGDSSAEVFSLINQVWQEICHLSLRQRRALLLNSQELVIYFLQAGIGDEDLANILEFTTDEWADVKSKLPLSDSGIANLTAKESVKGTQSKANSIKKARHEARAKLRRLI